MIKKIILENYMSHAHTVIEPADGLTVLIGPNNCGKSAVVSALQTLCFNRSGEFMVRHGAKQASVTVETDDGHILTWRRKRDTVSYVIDGREVFRLNRALPDGLHDHLRLPRVVSADGTADFDIHFGEQKSPIFLLAESEGRAATFFASSSDAEKLLEMQRLHREQTAAAKSEARRLAKEVETFDRLLSFLAPVPELAIAMAEIDTEHAALNAAANKADDLHSELTAQKVIIAKRDASRKLLAATDGLSAPPKLDDAPMLAGALTKLIDAAKRSRRETVRSRTLVPLINPPALEDVQSLKRTVANFAAAQMKRLRAQNAKAALQSLKEKPELLDPIALTDMTNRWRTAGATANQRRAALVSADRELAQAKADIQSWAMDNPFCPVCRAPVDAEHLLSSAHASGGESHE